MGFLSTGTRAQPWLASAAALLLGGCVGDNVHFHGRVLQADGTPAANLRVGANDRQGTTVTDAEGRYDLSRSWSSPPLRFQIGVERSANDRYDSLQMDVALEGDDIQMPDVRLWDDALALSSTPSGGAHLQWKQPSEDLPFVSAYVVRESTASRTDVVWRSPGVDGTSIDLDPEVMEDDAATFILIADDNGGSLECTRSVCVRALSRPVAAAQAGSRVPLSRGKSCTVLPTQGSGTRLGVGGVCPLTDGIITWSSPAWSCDDGYCGEPQAVTIDLGAPTLVQRVLVRSLGVSEGAGWSLSTATAEEHFSEVARFSSSSGHDYVDATLAAPVTARFVRIVPSSGAVLEAISEVSVF